jgi:hypothetical protein
VTEPNPSEPGIEAVEALMDHAATRLRADMADALAALHPQRALLADLAEADLGEPPTPDPGTAQQQPTSDAPEPG